MRSPITDPIGPVFGLPGLLNLQAASQKSLVSNLFVFPMQPPGCQSINKRGDKDYHPIIMVKYDF